MSKTLAATSGEGDELHDSQQLPPTSPLIDPVSKATDKAGSVVLLLLWFVSRASIGGSASLSWTEGRAECSSVTGGEAAPACSSMGTAEAAHWVRKPSRSDEEGALEEAAESAADRAAVEELSRAPLDEETKF